jgi:hypothetical protein
MKGANNMTHYTLLADRLYKQNRKLERSNALALTVNTVLEVVGIAALVLIGNVFVWSWLLTTLIVKG